MSICLDAFHRIVRVIIELIEHHLVHLVVHRHRLLSREEPLRTPVLLLFEPWVISYLIDPVSLLRLGMQDLRDEVGTVL
jgi:hypothetical protein